jgi:bifunctional DNA-binding transcriptional regulator/antitoxin component of YhaV-PrlF toxin-antitoxin module
MPSKSMTVTLKDKNQLVVPPSIQRQAGIKSGDRLEFRVSTGSITITAVEPPAYKPTKAEWAAIRKGETAVARGESVPLTEFLNGLDSQNRKTGAKASRKIPR